LMKENSTHESPIPRIAERHLCKPADIRRARRCHK
jgi:hypothetical protein